MNNDEIKKIATLACLVLDEQEVERMKSSLTDILGLVTQLEAGGATNIESTFNPSVGVQRMRQDRITESDQRDIFQQNAPAVADGFYLVPKVIE